MLSDYQKYRLYEILPGLLLWAVFSADNDGTMRIGADSLGEKGKKSELVGKEAAERLIDEVHYNAPVDEHLADNLIPWLALFGGKMKVSKVSNHTRTNIYTTEKFLDVKFKVKDNIIESIL